MVSPIYRAPKNLEYDQGPENKAKGMERGLKRLGIASAMRAKGHPEQHKTIERPIGTMKKASSSFLKKKAKNF